MDPKVSKALIRGFAVLLFGCLWWWKGMFILPPRLIAIVVLFITLSLSTVWIFTGKRRLPLIGFLAYLVFSFLPFDIRPTHWIGRPRIVRVVMGLPTQAAIEAEQRGEIWLGGCMVSRFDPKWVITW
jgi:hypothetical protein